MSDLEQPAQDDHAAAIHFRDGVPVSDRFDDPYYSLEDGPAESAYVFVQGNRLPERFADGFSIAELGFGTGLNLLVALDAWEAAGIAGRFSFTSFEAFPMSAADMRAALDALPRAPTHKDALADAMARGADRFAVGAADVTLILGDARKTLPGWSGAADAWFLDGFAPARNPELWEPALLDAVARHTCPAGSFATYTAAGDVRRALAAAGFEVTRVPGFGRKRHMSVGHLR